MPDGDSHDLVAPGLKTFFRTFKRFIIEKHKRLIGHGNERGMDLIIFVAVPELKKRSTNQTATEWPSDAVKCEDEPRAPLPNHIETQPRPIGRGVRVIVEMMVRVFDNLSAIEVTGIGA